MDIKKLGGKLEAIREYLLPEPPAPSKDIVEQVQELSKTYFENVSKVVDENGEPRVVYHITDNNFTVFDLSQSRQNMDIPAF